MAKTIKFRETTSGWRFRYRADNGEIILSGEGFTTKQWCLNSIWLVQQAHLADIVQGNPDQPTTWNTRPTAGNRRIFFWESSPRNWRWRYSGANGETIASGEGFTTLTGLSNTIRLVRESHQAQVSEEASELVQTSSRW